MHAAQRTEDYFSINEIAAFLGVSRRTIFRWEALRIGPPPTKIGALVLYRRESVDAWLKRNEAPEVRR